MGELIKQVIINAPVSRVYKFIADPKNAPRYISSITRVLSGPEGEPVAGQVWRAEASFLGSPRTLNLRLDELVPNRSVRFVLEGDPRADLLLHLTPNSDHTRTGVSLSLDVPGVPGILVNAMLGNLLAGDMDRLKAILEA